MKRALCAAVLCFEAVVLGLTTPVLISIRDVDPGTALSIGLGLAVLCVLTAGMLRREWAYWLGWLVQLAALALGFEIRVMFVLGLIFFILWLTAYLLGGRIDADRRHLEAVSAPAESEPVVPPAQWDHELVCDEETSRPFVRAALGRVLAPRNLVLSGAAAALGVVLLVLADTGRPAGVLLIAAAVVFPVVSFLAQRQAWRAFLPPGRRFRTALEQDRLVVGVDDRIAGVAYDVINGVRVEGGVVSIETGEPESPDVLVQLPEPVLPAPEVERLRARL